MSTKKTNDVAELSILGWILKNGILNEKGEPLDFRDRLFMLDILTDWSEELVIKKSAQVGGSLLFNLKALFAIAKFGWNIIYTFPTDADVKEFVSSKTNKLLEANPHVFAGLPTDNIERKELDGRFIFFKGTVSKTAAIMTSADALIHDEASRSDQSKLEFYKSRLKGATSAKRRWLFSNPTTEKDAVDEAWRRSDQKEWVVTCESCKVPQQLRWPESIDPIRKCFQCTACKAVLSRESRRTGRWEKQNPNSVISGYHISLLMAPWVTAEEILKDSEGDQEYFHNFVLGEPYNPGDLRVSRATILDNWTPKKLETGKWYLGVDVGNIKHYVLGSEKGITQVGRFTKWSDLDDMMKFYKPHLVIDAQPDNTMSRYFVENYENALMWYHQDNENNPQRIVWWGENDKKGIVYAHRNRVIDQLIDHILNAKMLFGMNSDQELKQYLKHWETLRRIKEVTPKGIERYVWESTTGEDHYVFATLYYYLATLGEGQGVFYGPDRGELPNFIGRDNIVGDISQAFEDNNG